MHSSAESSSVRLLIVEDEGILALDLEQHVRSLGFTVVGVAATADEALQLAREGEPDLALVDVRIRGALDGIETARALRADYDVPAVFLTAHGDPQTLERAHALNPLGYLLKPFKRADLQNVLAIAVARDVRERSLLRREQLVSTTLAAIGEAVITCSLDSTITFMNQAAERLTGLSHAQWGDRPLAELVRFVDERTGDPLLVPWAQAIATRAPVEFSGVVLQPRAGLPRLMVGTVSPLLEGQEASGSVLVLRDLTELLTMRRQLEFVDRLSALGTLAAGVAHEINNPLSYLNSNLEHVQAHARGVSELLRPLDPDWPEVLESLDDAVEGARRVTQIVKDLRTLGRRPADGARHLDPREAVRFALAVTANEWKPRAALKLELEPTASVLADETRLGQVLVNLIINASHAMQTTFDNQLTVVTRTNPQGEVVIEVADTGTGIPPALRERIFEPFFTTKGAGQGSGLGLSISLDIVGRLGGRLELAEGRERGTVVRVILPGQALAPTQEAARA